MDTSRNARCRAELRATSPLSTELLWAFLPPSYAPTLAQTPPSAVGTAVGPESPHLTHSTPRISTSTLMAATPEAHTGPQGCPAKARPSDHTCRQGGGTPGPGFFTKISLLAYFLILQGWFWISSHLSELHFPSRTRTKKKDLKGFSPFLG